MTRITGAEVRADAKPFAVGCWLLTLDAHQLADTLDADAANAGDAAEWRALGKVRAHAMRCSSTALWHHHGEVHCTLDRDASTAISAPTPTELLAKLDALAEAAKPKEVWRWYDKEHDAYSRDTFASVEEARKVIAYAHAISPHKWRVVREVTRPDGVIELHPDKEGM